MVVTMVFIPGGCVAHGTSAGRDADASIAGLRADVREMNTALVQLKTDVHAGRDVNTNDKWTLRLLGLGVMLLGLSYPIGKLVWILSGAIQRKARWVVLAAARQRAPAMLQPAASPPHDSSCSGQRDISTVAD